MAATVAQGVHGRKRIGLGETFWQFRPYEPGDPYTRIDWRQSAKRNRHYVRQYEWEAAQTAFLWRDGSDSMNYSSRNSLPTKGARADLLVLALASLLVRSGERVGLLGAQIPASQRRGIIHRIGHLMSQGLWRTGDLPGVSLDGAFQALPKYATLVLVGDFLEPVEEIQSALIPLARRGVYGHILQILDPAELSLPFSGRVQFHGLQGEKEDVVIPNVETVREEYREKIGWHCDAVRALTQSIGWTFGRHITSHSAESALLSLYVALSGEMTQ